MDFVCCLTYIISIILRKLNLVKHYFQSAKKTGAGLLSANSPDFAPFDIKIKDKYKIFAKPLDKTKYLR